MGIFWSKEPERKWKRQEMCHQILEKLTGKKFIREGFYPWLSNPETNHSLQLDAYNKELKLALEYNGIQHYVYPNKFHSSKKEFENQRKRDQIKMNLCKKAGVHLIVVPYTIKDEELEAYIKKRLPKRAKK